jgi:hydrogenase maturation protein HypF
VPLPVALPQPAPEHILALGAELKSTVCFVRGQNAFLSQHIGDLKNPEACDFFRQVVTDLSVLLDTQARVIAHDHHPAYFSTRFARKLRGVQRIAVQHHHAHLASCLAEHGRSGPALGIICDGVGFGEDGTAWGGELLVGDARSYRRVGHLRSIGLPGGDAAAREPWRMALAYLVQAFGDDLSQLDLPVLGVRPKKDMEVVVEMIRRGVNCPATTSLGRLFDAASALASVALENTYEGQAPMEFEGIAEEGERGAYPYELQADEGMLTIDASPLIRALAGDVSVGVQAEVVSARFHNAVSAFLAEAGARLAKEAGVGLVVLSGGCFQNQRLTEGVTSALEARGFEVLTHSLVPANDGGIALGQAWVAANRLAGERQGG